MIWHFGPQDDMVQCAIAQIQSRFSVNWISTIGLLREDYKLHWVK